MPVVRVECWVVALVGGEVAFVGSDAALPPVWTAIVHGEESPVRRVAETATYPIQPDPHSTSWRYESGEIRIAFLATAAHDDPTDVHRVPVYLPTDLARVADVDRHRHVASHAVRHLAFLARTDPPFAAAENRRWQEALASYVPDVFRDLSR